MCMLLRKELAQAAIAGLVVDRIDDEVVLVGVVRQREQAQFADQPRRQILRDKRLVLVVAHREVERPPPIRPGNIGKPFAVFVVGSLADPFEIFKYREAERVRIHAAEGLTVKAGLMHDVGVTLQEFQHEAIVDQSLFV